MANQSGTRCAALRTGRVANSDQRRLIQGKYRLLRNQRFIRGYFHKDGLEGNDAADLTSREISAGEMAAIVMVGRFLWRTVMLRIVVVAVMCSAFIVPIVGDAVHHATNHPCEDAESK